MTCCSLQTKENENKSVSFARCKWSSDNASFDELKKYFSSIEDFPDVSLLDGILFYKFSGASHCIRFSARCNALFPGCGAAYVHPTTARHKEMQTFLGNRYLASCPPYVLTQPY